VRQCGLKNRKRKTVNTALRIGGHNLMPRLVRSVPRYCKHRASGQAVVTLSGQDFYLGPHGTKASKLEYDRLIAEWLARGRRPLDAAPEGEATVMELLAAYHAYAKGYYRKNGEVTSEVAAILSIAKLVKDHYGREPASEFDPLKLQALQQTMIRLGWTRRNINRQCQRIVRMFSWAVAQKLVKVEVVAALREVPGLHVGRTAARESTPVLPVDESTVNTTLAHLPPLVADMVRLQRLTGCRPEEVCLIRPCDVDASGAVWAYRPQSHKTMHHGRERVIFIGPRGQDVLRPYLLRDKQSYCFSPAEGERKRRDAMHAARVTPLGYGNRPGTNRSAKPQRPAGERYNTESYRRAIHRGCELAFEMPDTLRKPAKDETAEQKAARLKAASAWRDKHCWAPNQLRHSAATEIRKRFGLEAAQVTLGHAAADVTQVYAERDMEKAAAVMAQVG
jgi:integrase